MPKRPEVYDRLLASLHQMKKILPSMKFRHPDFSNPLVDSCGGSGWDSDTLAIYHPFPTRWFIPQTSLFVEKNYRHLEHFQLYPQLLGI